MGCQEKIGKLHNLLISILIPIYSAINVFTCILYLAKKNLSGKGPEFFAMTKKQPLLTCADIIVPCTVNSCTQLILFVAS